MGVGPRRGTSPPRPFDDDHQRAVGHVPAGKSFTIMVRSARLPWHPAAGLALPADDGRLWRGVKRAGWNRAHDLASRRSDDDCG